MSWERNEENDWWRLTVDDSGFGNSDPELREKLEDYFHFGVVMPSYEMKKSKACLMKYLDVLKRELRSVFVCGTVKLDVGKPTIYGAVWNDSSLQQDCAETFDVVFPVKLDVNVWDCDEINDSSSGSYEEYVCYPTSIMFDDQGMYDSIPREEIDTLDPCMLVKAFQDELEVILENRFHDDELCTWQKSDLLAATALSMILIRPDSSSDVMVNITPALQISKSHSEVFLLEPRGSHWQRSFAFKENRLLEWKDRRDNGCRKMMFQILKSLAGEMQSPLAHLDADFFKNVVLTILDSVNWEKSCVSQCFKQVLHFVKVSCGRRWLQRFSEPYCNVLHNYPSEIMDNVCNSLQEISECNDYARFFR